MTDYSRESGVYMGQSHLKHMDDEFEVKPVSNDGLEQGPHPPQPVPIVYRIIHGWTYQVYACQSPS